MRMILPMSAAGKLLRFSYILIPLHAVSHIRGMIVHVKGEVQRNILCVSRFLTSLGCVSYPESYFSRSNSFLIDQKLD